MLQLQIQSSLLDGRRVVKPFMGRATMAIPRHLPRSPRHRTSSCPLPTLKYFITLIMAAEESGESGNDKQLSNRSRKYRWVYIRDPCSFPALALWALT
jgi:hypothetical protein